MKSEREKTLARDIKNALKAEATGAQIADMLAEWEELSTKNVLLETALQFFEKEKPLAERTLEIAIKRGFKPGGEYGFISALVHFAVLVYSDKRYDAALQALKLAGKMLHDEIEGKSSSSPLRAAVSSGTGSAGSSTGSLNRPNKNVSLPREGSPDKDMMDMRDFAAFFLSVLQFQLQQFEQCVKSLDELSNYTIVLDQEHFSLVALLKVRALIRLKQYSDALGTLSKRQNQEAALSQVSAAAKKLTAEDLAGPKNAQNWCRRLHVLLLSALNQGDEAVLLFSQLVPGSKMNDAKEFIKKHYKSIDVGGDEYLAKWRPDPSKLTRRM